MIKKQVLFLIFLTLSGTALTGQNLDWSFHGDLGVSRIPILTKIKYNGNRFHKNEVNFYNHSSTSPSCGINADLKIFNNTFLSSGLSMVYMSGVRKQIGASLGGVDNQQFHTSYRVSYIDQSLNLALPFAFKFKFNKVHLKVGVQFMYFLKGKVEKQITRFNYFDGAGFLEDATSEQIIFKQLDYGLTSGVSYRFNNLFSMDLNLYWGLDNILEDRIYSAYDGVEHIRKNQRLSFGLSYHFSNKNL